MARTNLRSSLEGGISLLRQTTNFELSKQAKKSAFPSGYWTDKENQRVFLESFAKKHGIHRAQDWGKVSTRHFSSDGGVSVLKHFKGSLFRTLVSSFPGELVFYLQE